MDLYLPTTISYGADRKAAIRTLISCANELNLDYDEIEFVWENRLLTVIVVHSKNSFEVTER
jgi:hypothetical protein